MAPGPACASLSLLAAETLVATREVRFLAVKAFMVLSVPVALLLTTSWHSRLRSSHPFLSFLFTDICSDAKMVHAHHSTVSKKYTLIFFNSF